MTKISCDLSHPFNLFLIPNRQHDIHGRGVSSIETNFRKLLTELCSIIPRYIPWYACSTVVWITTRPWCPELTLQYCGFAEYGQEGKKELEAQRKLWSHNLKVAGRDVLHCLMRLYDSVGPFLQKELLFVLILLQIRTFLCLRKSCS